MGTKICVTSQIAVGCTFLDWSIHFLSGQSDFFNCDKGWVPLSKNPLTKINAHVHPKNHPSGLIQTRDIISILQTQNKLTSFYPHEFYADKVAEQLNIDCNTMSADHWKMIQEYRLRDYNQLLYESYLQDAKVIFVSFNKKLSTYMSAIRFLGRMQFSDQMYGSPEDRRKEHDQIFFKDYKIWNDMNLTNTWDIRERRALANNLLTYQPGLVELNFNHYWLDSQTLWYDGEREIEKIMLWTELSIDQKRFNRWKPIYKEWQKMQIAVLQFDYNYEHIVESIVNNWSYPIDLTFEQEVIIQHCLIYQHGLNLKTWQLEKFPNNTKELHKLLEPNIHSL
jgi:hypothetical protein